MTICSTLVQAAYREGNLLPAGQSPTATEVTEAQTELNAIVRQTLAQLRGVPLQAFLANSGATYPYTAQKHTRIMQNGATGTIKFPAAPDPGARMALVQGPTSGGTLTLDGNGYTIGGTATVNYVAPTSTSVEWFFREDTGDWKSVLTLATSDDFLFPQDFDDLFTVLILNRLGPRYNKKLTAEQQTVIVNAGFTLKARYFQGARLDVDRTNLMTPSTAGGG